MFVQQNANSSPLTPMTQEKKIREARWERFSSLDSKDFDEFEEKIALYIEMKVEKGASEEEVIQDLRMNRGLNFGDLCSCDVREPSVHGKGLFATYPIAKGDVITIYPSDIHAFYDDDNIVYELPPESHPLFATPQKLQDYVIELDDFVLVGDPFLIEEDDSSYLGHMINDGMKCSSFEGEDAYKYLSPKIANAGFCLISKHFMCVVATRNIAPNEEIFVSYGVTYWQRKYSST